MTTASELAAEVPLIELLRRIPKDYRAQWTDADGLQASHSVPVGRYCHEAADALERRTPPEAGDARVLRDSLSPEARTLLERWLESPGDTSPETVARVRAALAGNPAATPEQSK